MKNLRIETIVTNLMDINVYVTEMMQLKLSHMDRIKRAHHKVVGVDTTTSNYDTDEEDRRNAEDDCQHDECHAVVCKRQAKYIERVRKHSTDLDSDDYLYDPVDKKIRPYRRTVVTSGEKIRQFNNTSISPFIKGEDIKSSDDSDKEKL